MSQTTATAADSRARPLEEMLAWQDRAACSGVDPELFFPAKGESLAPAKAICAGCPVRVECLEYALTHNERYGIWGGTSERERRRLRRRRREEAARRRAA